MKKLFSIFSNFFILLLTLASCSKSDGEVISEETVPDVNSTMTKNTFASAGSGNIGYWLYAPKDPQENMPLIVYLHGGSGRGTDLNLVVSGSLPQFLLDGSIKDIDAYILMPQCPSGKTWEQLGTAIIELIDNVTNSKKINSKKISLTGHSLGGSGTWRLGATYASKFSCIAPLSGSVQKETASSYINTPIWAFVGSNDDIVIPDHTTNIIPIINNLGGNAQVKVYDGATHFDVPELTYKDISVNLLDWLISKEK